MRLAPILALLLLAGTAHAAEPACGDFLEQLGVASPGLHFEGCKLEEGGQLRQLVAEYLVPGPQAHGVEKLLQQRFGLQPLRFMCCGWDTRPASAPHASGRPYEIRMSSGETLEKDWARIDRFHVSVTLYLEDP